MNTLVAPIRRSAKAFVIALAVVALAVTALVTLAPAANAAYKPYCLVSNQQPHRGDVDTAQCFHFTPRYKHGKVVVRQFYPKHNHHRAHFKFFKIGKIKTGPNGNALHVKFKVKRVITPGVHKFIFETGRKHYVLYLNVKR